MTVLPAMGHDKIVSWRIKPSNTEVIVVISCPEFKTAPVERPD